MKRPIHASHRMGKAYTDVRAPAGTARFYSVRQCKGCEAEEIAHPAGQFTDDDLVRPCRVPRPSSSKKAVKPKTTVTKRSR